MPASSINLYHMQDAKNNFATMRPAPVCTNANLLMSHCQNVHISKDCYYGYHDPKGIETVPEDVDCEMEDALHPLDKKVPPSQKTNARKRSAEESSYPQTKRQREEVQIKKSINPETIEKKKLEPSSEDLVENLYWNLHGGNFFHLLQCL